MFWNTVNSAILITPNTKKKNTKICKFHYLPQLGTGDSSVAYVGGAGPILVTAREISLMQNGATVTPTTHKTYTYVVSMEK